MSRRSAALPMILALVALSLTGCDDGGPEPTVPVRVAHAAPGLGSYEVAIDGRSVGVLSARESLADTLGAGEHTIEVSGGGGSLGAADEVEDGQALAGVLMDADAPTLRVYRNTHFGSEWRFVVINAVPATDLDYILDGSGARFMSTGHGYQETTSGGLSAGVYEVKVWQTGTADTVSLGDISFPPGRSFLVFYPNPGGPNPFSVLAF